jgi:hypothetical protein
VRRDAGLKLGEPFYGLPASRSAHRQTITEIVIQSPATEPDLSDSGAAIPRRLPSAAHAQTRQRRRARKPLRRGVRPPRGR